MALLQTQGFSLFKHVLGTKQGLTGLDIRFGVCVTQVCNRMQLAVPRFRHPIWHLRKDRANRPQYLSPSNQEFIDEKIAEKYGAPGVVHGVQTFDSPLKNVEMIKPIDWFPGIRRTSTIAKKIGICPLWKKDGSRVMSTLLHIVDNHVIRYNPPDQVIPLRRKEEVIRKKNRGKYGALVVGAESADPQLTAAFYVKKIYFASKQHGHPVNLWDLHYVESIWEMDMNFTKEYCGLFKSSGLPPKRKLARFLISPEAVLPVGTPLNVMHYRVNDYVDVTSQTIMRGFQGVVRRWKFKGMPKTHGTTKTHRRPGNIGGGGEKGRVWPGKKMPGHMGGKHRTLRALKILRINTEYNVMWVIGQNVPGDIGSYVYIHDSLIRQRWITDPANARALPTYIPEQEDKPLPSEFWASDMHPFGDPSITYEIVDTPPVKTGAKTAKTGAKTAKLRTK